jgi:integrase
MTDATKPPQKAKKKAQNGAGTVERRGALWWVRVSAPGMPRKRIPIADSEKMTELQAKRAGARIAADVRAKRIVFDEKPRKGALPSPVMTVRQLGEAWTSGELLKMHGAVNRLRVKATAATDSWTMAKHVYGVRTRGPAGPVFGDLPVAQVTSDDVSAVMASHSMALAAQTRMHTYQRLRRLFDLAIFPCKLRKEGDNPVTRYVRPERDPEKLFCFLYPSELIALLRGTDDDGKTVVPLGRRVLYAIATFTGQRKGSLYALRWKHVDFAHGTLAGIDLSRGEILETALLRSSFLTPTVARFRESSRNGNRSSCAPSGERGRGPWVAGTTRRRRNSRLGAPGCGMLSYRHNLRTGRRTGRRTNLGSTRRPPRPSRADPIVQLLG